MATGQIFDVDAVVAALEPPVFVAGGRRRVGVFLSIEEWHAFTVRHGAVLALGATGAEWRAHLRLFLDAVFPPARIRRALARWRQLEALLARWWPTVADLVLQLPHRRQLEAFNLFLVSLAREQMLVTDEPSEPGPTSETETTATTLSAADASPSPM